MMLDITTIILTYNEHRHIGRCLENALKFSKKVYVIDSLSTDGTQDICHQYAHVEVIEHAYPGNQAAQFNWALGHIRVDTEWTLRLDADEYLSYELILEIENKLPLASSDISGFFLKRDVIFMNTRIRHGQIGTVKLLRLWRSNYGYIENRLMDEHCVLRSGRAVVLENYFFDENLNGIDEWIKKHLNYSDREVRMIKKGSDGDTSSQMVQRNRNKKLYYKLPRYHRAFVYFILRYVFFGGFLDGRAGFIWCFLQCWWYRTIVDVKLEQETPCAEGIICNNGEVDFNNGF